MSNIETFLDKLNCPHCGKAIPINEALQKQLTEKAHAELDAEKLRLHREYQQQKRLLEEERSSIERIVSDKVSEEKSRMEKKARENARAELGEQLDGMKKREEEREKKLRILIERENELIRQKQAAEDKAQEAKLEAARQLDEERAKIKDDTLLQAAEQHRLKEAEYERKLQEALRAHDDMKRKLEQGSQQMQGEVLELELEDTLKGAFPMDVIEEVPKGVSGADVVHRVIGAPGNRCGTLVWEVKRTKTWSESWIQKLKDDQRLVKAEMAILVTETLPKDVRNFTNANGVWVATPLCAIGLATALRMHLIEVEQTKLASVGKQEKMEVLYKYLSGSEFKQRVEAIVEAFVEMQTDLESEKRTAVARWAKREKQIQRVISNTSGMYGDFQGLIGASLQTIPALEAGSVEAEESPIPVTELF